jgi:thymidylate synthase (FAD)
MTDESYLNFLRNHFEGGGHTNMLRFSMIVVEFMVDRGVAQEILRHLATLVGLHESQRYCNYSKDKFGNSVGFIKPYNLDPGQEAWWHESMQMAELQYFKGLGLGLRPQIAADALPRASAGKVSLGGCFQAWRHFTLVRSTIQCHPKLLNVTVEDNEEPLSDGTKHIQVSLLKQFKALFPIFFDDIEPMGDYITNIKKVR